MNRYGARLGHLLAFALVTGLSLSISFILYAVMGLSECLPRNGSAEMHVCDAVKRLDFWAFPLFALISLSGAMCAAWKRPGAGMILIVASPFLALALLVLVRRAVF